MQLQLKFMHVHVLVLVAAAGHPRLITALPTRQ